MDYTVLAAFGLMALGVALILAEVFLPSGGVISFLAGLCFVGSLVLAYRAWGETRPGAFWAFLGGTTLLIPSTVVVALWWLSRSRFGERLFLNAPDPDEVRPYREEQSLKEKLQGKFGRTVTLMTPGGLIEIEGERHHAVSEGVMIEPGNSIKVIEVQGNRIVVRAQAPNPEPTATNDVLSSEGTQQAASQTAKPADASLVNPVADPLAKTALTPPPELTPSEATGDTAHQTTSTDGTDSSEKRDQSASSSLASTEDPPLDFEIPGS